MTRSSVSVPRLISTGNPETDNVLRQYRRSIEELEANPILRGHQLTVNDSDRITPVNGSVNKLAHKLGRKLVGYIITGIRGATSTGRIVQVTSSGGVSANDETDLWLDVQGHGANITAGIYVY